MRKKVFSIIMAAVMAFPTLVYADQVSEPSEIHEDLDMIIEQRLDLMMDDVYLQLESQDAVDLAGLYEEIFRADVELEVMEEYGLNTGDISLLANSGANTYTFTYGGFITYLRDIPDESKPCQVAVECLDQINSYHYILTQDKFTIKSIALSILGYLPKLGSITSLVVEINSKANSAAKTSIDKAQGYTKIINTYDPNTGSKASVVTGWNTHNKYTTPSGAYDINSKSYSYHNPW